MKRNLFFVFTIGLFCVQVAEAKDEMTTYHKDGVFVSKCSVKIEASDEAIRSTIKDFIDQYHNDLDALYKWAFVGVKLRGEQDDFIMFNIKSHQPQNGIVHSLMDINISFIRKKYADVSYRVELKKINDTPDRIDVSYKLTQCDEVIRETDALFSIVKQGNDIYSVVEADVKLTRFYDRFMTLKQYRENIEWRFQRFLENLRDEAERRTNDLK